MKQTQRWIAFLLCTLVDVVLVLRGERIAHPALGNQNREVANVFGFALDVDRHRGGSGFAAVVAADSAAVTIAGAAVATAAGGSGTALGRTTTASAAGGARQQQEHGHQNRQNLFHA